MAHLKVRVEFLLGVIELLFLSLTDEALQGNMCQNSLPSRGGRSQDFRGKRSSPCQHIATTRKAIDRARTSPMIFFIYNETLLQTSRPLLSKLSKRRQTVLHSVGINRSTVACDQRRGNIISYNTATIFPES